MITLAMARIFTILTVITGVLFNLNGRQGELI